RDLHISESRLLTRASRRVGDVQTRPLGHRERAFHHCQGLARCEFYRPERAMRVPIGSQSGGDGATKLASRLALRAAPRSPRLSARGGAPQGLRAPGEAAHRGWAGYFCIWLWSLRIQYLSALARQAWPEAFCMSSWVTLGACSSRDGLRTSLPSRTMELAVLYGTGTLSPLEPETTT